MRFEVSHQTCYSYDRPVSLGPHLLRLRPRCDGGQRLVEFGIEIEPRPQTLSHYLDHAGNVVTQVGFECKTERLSFTSRFRLHTLRCNPFDFLPDPDFVHLPVRYAPTVRQALIPYLHPGSPRSDDPVLAFTRSLAEEAGGDPLVFLGLLNRAIFTGFTREIREQGEPQAPEVTLRRARGACRDLAQLFVAGCRCHGFAARFVSGYQMGEGQRKRRYLHAWPEVYLPGGGWRGYDPTHGLAVADAHVPVAAAAHPQGATPIEGHFMGAATSRMETRLSIRID